MVKLAFTLAEIEFPLTDNVHTFQRLRRGVDQLLRYEVDRAVTATVDQTTERRTDTTQRVGRIVAGVQNVGSTAADQIAPDARSRARINDPCCADEGSSRQRVIARPRQRLNPAPVGVSITP